MGVFALLLPLGLLLGMRGEHFLHQKRAECHFQNGTQWVRALDRYFWDRQEIFYFDSDLERYVALTELVRSDMEQWNQEKDALRRKKTEMDSFCRHNYGVLADFSSRRKVQPRVKITPTSQVSSSGHNTLLICDVAKFFPSKIEIKWLKNGKELEDPFLSTDLIRNGGWTFQIQAMLEMQPERGDVYACWVNHTSFEDPVMVQWEAQSDAARSKMWTGVMGIILGLVFMAVGLTFYLCSKKASSPLSPSEGIST